jgi:multidrug resistance efflux pump
MTGVWLVACSSDDASHDDHDRAFRTTQDEPSTPNNRIDITPTVRRNLGITFAPVERRRVASTIRVPGAFELRSLARREYRMVLPGEVELKVDQYQRVEAGDLLYRFRSPQWPELQHEIIVGEQAIASAQAEIAVVESKIEESGVIVNSLRDRLDALAEAKVRRADLEAQADQIDASIRRQQAELALARTKLDNAERTREHALHRAAAATGLDEGMLDEMTERNGERVPAYRLIDWVDVRANRAGLVETLALTDGAFAEASAMVMSTVDLSLVRFHAEALQADLSRLSMLGSARIVPPGDADNAEQVVNAEVAIGLEANPRQRTIALLATPTEHRGWVRPGVSAFLEASTESTDGPALAIPRAAIVKDGIVHVFFRRDPKDPNKAIRVEADMGISDGRWVVIESGLTLQDEVVLDGAYELKLASQQSGTQQKGGHFHADGTFHPTDDH